MAFDPPLATAAVGDVIHFVATDPGHDAEAIPGMLPKGVAPFKGVLNKDVTFVAAKPGLYGIECSPHFFMGMVALIVVGKPKAADIDAAQNVSLPPFAAKRMKGLIAQVR